MTNTSRSRAFRVLSALAATALTIVASTTALPAYADEAPVSGSYLTVPNTGPFEEGELIVADFVDGTITLQGSCNSLSGSTTWDATTLTVGTLMGTLVACDEDAMAEDQWLTTWLAKPLLWSMDGENLTLTDGATALTFERNLMMQASGAPGLKHTSWVLLGYRKGSGATVRLPHTSSASLQIKGKQLRFNTGCNQAWGPVKVRPGGLRIGQLAMTRVGCSGAAATLEKHMLATLKGEVKARQRGAKLTLRHGDHVLVFRRK